MQSASIRHAALAAALAGILAGSGAVRAEELIRVGLPTAVEIPYAAVDAAQELGLYASHGIKAEITPYRGAGAAQEALAAGAADVINLIPSAAAVARTKGVEEEIVACGPQMLPDQWYLLANAKGSIQSVKDLDGKKIGVSSKNSTTDFYALWTGKHAGIKIQTVPLGGSTWQALKSDQVSAIVASGQLSLHLLLAKEARPLLHFREAMEPNIPECWVATSKIIRERPKVIRGFIDAVERATERMQKDQALGMTLLKKYLDEKDDAYVKLAYDTVIKTLTTDGRVDLKALGNSLELAKLAGITNLPEPKSLVPDFAVAPASK